MNRIILFALAFVSFVACRTAGTQSMTKTVPAAEDAPECVQHVEDRPFMYSVCGINDDGKPHATVKACQKVGASHKCQIEAEPWPSSGCQVEVTLDQNCYFNRSARITNEGREDMAHSPTNDPEECRENVAKYLSSFVSICGGIHEFQGREIKPHISSCEKIGEVFVCKAGHDPWPSSGCDLEIVMDGSCYYNKETRITNEGREDI